MNIALTVQSNKVVTIIYSLTNADGVVVRDAASKPVNYLHGAGSIPPRLEQALHSHKIGDTVKARLLPDDAFGKRDPELVCDVPLDEIPVSETIEIGGRIVGTDQEGNEVTFVITAIDNGVASLDGNHPLADVTLNFDISVVDVRAATQEEIDHGHVHGPGGHHH